MDYFSRFANKSVLITGGLGFIGSNLAHRLVELKARVTLLDSMVPDHGGNLHNLDGIQDAVTVNFSDVRDPHALRYLIPNFDFLFNMAGQVSHRDSMEKPLIDLEINVASQLSLLESCRRLNPEIRIVFASTRQFYGRVKHLPVSEEHPISPTDVNGVNKMAAEWYHLIYHNVYGLRTTALRLSNIYGPRQLLRHSRQGFISGFIRLALQGRSIQIYGDGNQLRDLTHVDDVVDAFLRAASAGAVGKVYNVGANQAYRLSEIADTVNEVAGNKSPVEFVPFPEEYKKIDIGDFATDFSKICRELSWFPKMELRPGLGQTINFYRKNLEHYLGPEQ
ncbi:MAG: NAD-dependent epimerase/dehydratase family protein [Acidobacteria bacterium]|nr:NAD-dependent epimerase/dehydratase family protein [Acidobacteriota bacterium]